MIAVLCAAGAIGFACGKSDNAEGERNQQTVNVYDEYAVYARENGITPLSYEDWLAAITGDDGTPPAIGISTDGFWIINGVKTEYKTAAENGKVYYELYVEFPAWKDTAVAEDYNGDRKITFADFEYYKEFKQWKLSGNAFDYNGDRKITVEDFDLYNDPQNLSYLAWLDTEYAYDFDKNGFVDQADYAIYNERKDLIGNFKITNFNYGVKINGQDRDDITIYFNSTYNLATLSEDVGDFSFNLSEDLDLTCVYGEDVKQKIGQDETALLNTMDSCVFDKLSDTVTTATFSMKNSPFTVYLTKTENGYSSRVDFMVEGCAVNVTFDITYVKL